MREGRKGKKRTGEKRTGEKDNKGETNPLSCSTVQQVTPIQHPSVKQEIS